MPVRPVRDDSRASKSGRNARLLDVAGPLGGFAAPGAGRVFRAPLDGAGTVEEVAICQAKPSAIAVDAARVYWVNWVLGQVISAPK